MPVKPIPDGYHSITPYLMCENVPRLIDFLKVALGGVEKSRHFDDKGNVMHAEVQIGDSILMMSEANERYPARSAFLYHYVRDVDSTFRAAVEAGGKSIMEPTNHFYGDRAGALDDPSGNRWWISSHVEDVPEAELQKRMRELKPGA